MKMGCTEAKPAIYENINLKEESKANEEIEKMLKKHRDFLHSEVKLLLLGTGGSGKSTIAKQMRILHCGGFSKDDRINFKPIIINNTITNMKTLLENAKLFNLELSESNKANAEFIANLQATEEELPKETANKLKQLWADAAIQQTYDRRNEFHLMDNASYCFEHLDKFAAEDYCPDEDDVLRARTQTTGIVETTFQVNDMSFRMVDVGGQRSERKKWIHCFEDVTAIIYCVALNEYDMKLPEDEKTNGLMESLELFEEICNSKWFVKTSIIVFLNKSDLFKEKIKRVNLNTLFKDYSGANEYDNGIAFLTKKFLGCNRNQQKKIFSHVTQATSTEVIRVVFDATKDIILHNNLESQGII